MNPTNPFEGVPVVFSYSRAQAIEDGVLIDLTPWAAETGFRIPVACTATVWNQYIMPSLATRELGQSERGRAHDVLWMLYLSIRKLANRSDDRLFFEVIFLQEPEKHETIRFKSICGPGDNGKPVLTILLPDED